MRETPPVETPLPSYRQHRYPAAIIAHWVRLYYRFPLRYRGVTVPACYLLLSGQR